MSTSRPIARRGVTLLELLVVLVILALLASLVVSGIGRSGEGRQRRNAMVSAMAQLSLARIHAMERAEDVSVVTEVEGDSLNVHWNGVDKQWDTPGTALLDEELQPVPSVSVHFDRDGRTTTRELRFGRLGRGGGGEGVIWTIEFDVISGAPRLVHAGE